MSQELSRVVSVDVKGGLQETLLLRAQNFIISLNELDTNASQACYKVFFQGFSVRSGGA